MADIATVDPDDEGATVPRWATDAIVDAGRRMDALGWVRATAGNLSVRLDDGTFAVTTSGQHKGFLDADGIMAMTLDAVPTTEGRPSAEAGLHAQLYRLLPNVGAIVHGHSVPATVLSMIDPRDTLILSGYEVLKAFGHRSHDVSVAVPLFDNGQDIAALADRVEPRIDAGTPGYVLRGHGAYAWGVDMAHALARMEALEFLLACELERRRVFS